MIALRAHLRDLDSVREITSPDTLDGYVIRDVFRLPMIDAHEPQPRTAQWVEYVAPRGRNRGGFMLWELPGGDDDEDDDDNDSGPGLPVGRPFSPSRNMGDAWAVASVLHRAHACYTSIHDCVVSAGKAFYWPTDGRQSGKSVADAICRVALCVKHNFTQPEYLITTRFPAVTAPTSPAATPAAARAVSLRPSDFQMREFMRVAFEGILQQNLTREIVTAMGG